MTFSSLSRHHAVLITSSTRANSSEALWTEIVALSPAHRYFNQTVLDIETAREIISWAKTPYEGERVGLISFHTAGVPAQNALLKILEEPPHNTRFILLTSNISNLLPTVISRLDIHPSSVDSLKETLNSEAVLFLNTRPTDRMKLPFVVALLEKKDEADRKDRESVREFILSLLPLLPREKNNSYIIEVLETSSYASDPSASGKALIEYLSLLLPQTS